MCFMSGKGVYAGSVLGNFLTQSKSQSCVVTGVFVETWISRISSMARRH